MATLIGRKEREREKEEWREYSSKGWNYDKLKEEGILWENWCTCPSFSDQHHMRHRFDGSDSIRLQRKCLSLSLLSLSSSNYAPPPSLPLSLSLSLFFRSFLSLSFHQFSFFMEFEWEFEWDLFFFVSYFLCFLFQKKFTLTSDDDEEEEYLNINSPSCSLSLIYLFSLLIFFSLFLTSLTFFLQFNYPCRSLFHLTVIQSQRESRRRHCWRVCLGGMGVFGYDSYS